MSRSTHVRAVITAAIALAAVALVAGCNDDEGFTSVPDGAVVDAPSDGALVFPDASYDLPTTVIVTPTNQQLTVETGKPVPTVQYVAKMGGKVVTATWRLDRGELGTISGGGLFTPSGKVGGEGQITATVGSLKGGTTVKVLLKMSQNGLTKQNGNPGPGGFGGVGGEGLGPAVSATVKAALDAAPKADAKLKLLYPYDETVWPLGLLAPLLQWSALTAGSAEGVRIELATSNFSFVGYFGRPAALASGAPFVRHPLPQDVWKAATRSAAGKTLTVKVVVAAAGAAYGPLTQTWTIANGALRGTVYYQSYGTNLAKNYAGALGVPGGMFGGATLAIKGGSADPVLVAGKSGGSAQCRVCHSVSADGSRMVVQHGDNYKRSSSYDLLKGYTETPYPASTDTKMGWVGMTPDGMLGLGNAVPVPGGANSGATTALYDMTTGAALTTTGLTSFVTHAGFPMFSPDGKLVAFNFYAGPGDATIGIGDGSKLVVMDFDVTTKAFSKPRQLYKGTASSRPGWPAFWPTNTALLFQRELAGAKEFFATRNGGKGELWWVDLATGQAQALHRLNGKTTAGTPYLPTGPSNHDKDAELNYEPTVSPIASGGYAWVVLTSRRLYGNVATIDPWASDPRYHDLTKTPTPKKLWVAALDLNPKAGSDPSHPAFYLPAQELLAGNTRGFWVADPCKPDGQPFEGGDECCGGYCTQQGGTGPLVCGKALVGCAKEFDKCVQATDCCDYPKFQCVNGHCARWQIN
jgi:hypothetical protein